MPSNEESRPGDHRGDPRGIPIPDDSTGDQPASSVKKDSSPNTQARNGIAPPGVHALEWSIYQSGLFDGTDKAAEIERKLNPPQPRPTLPASLVGAGRRRSYALIGLSNELGILSRQTEPGRNEQLNITTFKVARFVRDGVLSRDEVVGPLRETAMAIGLPEREIDRTIRSAFAGADAKGLHTEIPDRAGYGTAQEIGGDA